MGLVLEIQRTSDVPVYRQIIEQIVMRVRSGELKPGDQVPPERELSAQLGIARVLSPRPTRNSRGAASLK